MMMTESTPLQPGDIEYELDVAIPGVILPQEQWASTAIHKLPDGHLDWATIFGRTAPVILDIGCGNGRFIISSAVRRPECDHLGIDILPLVIRYATRRGKQRGLHNTRFAVRGGTEFLERNVAESSVDEIHIYHPQPYRDPKQGHLRLWRPDFLELVLRALKPKGKLFVQTDNQAYWNYMKPLIASVMKFEEQSGPWEEDPQGRSRREIIATQKGLQIYRGWAEKRPEMALEEVRTILQNAQQPTFKASQKKNRTGWRRKR